MAEGMQTEQQQPTQKEIQTGKNVREILPVWRRVQKSVKSGLDFKLKGKLTPEQKLQRMAAFKATATHDEKLKEAQKDLETETTAKEEIQKHVMYDNLTGAFSRELLFQRGEEMAMLGNRGTLSFSAFFIDLDEFKSVNDTFGHKKGDKVLKSLVKLIKKAIRKADTIYRYGGDEFVVLAPTAKEEDTPTIGEKIRKEVETSLASTLGITTPLTVTIGGASHKPGLSFADLLERADSAMYAGKKERNKSYVYQEGMPIKENPSVRKKPR